MEELKGFYYVTAATGVKHIEAYAQYALKSLIKTRVSILDVHCIVNNEEDKNTIKRLIPKFKNIHTIDEKLDHIRWTAHGGKRKFSVFKSAALHKCFTKPIKNKFMVYFDTDVLFFKNPEKFLRTKCYKTWFHHGKDLETVSVRKNRAGRLMKKEEVDVTNYRILSKWVSQPAAHCMIKHGAKKVPEKEAVAGFYILHPRDHEKLLKLTYENCLEIANKFNTNTDVGDQKPMNAALNTLEIDWHGGNRFECPEHLEYFNHYFGVKSMKKEFNNKIKEVKL
jgi:hypothetical protein